MNWRRRQTATFLPKVLLAIISAFLSFWLRCSTVDHWDRMHSVCKLILTLASCPQLAPTATGTELELTNWLTQAHGHIIVWRPLASCGRTHLHRIQPRPQVKVIFRHPRPDAPASPFFCLFTQVHLLIDGSVEGQYVTNGHEWHSQTFLSKRSNFNVRTKLWSYLNNFRY